MSRPLSHRIYTEVLSKWPKQELRPDYQLQDVIRATIDKRFQAYQPSMEAEELFKARSLQFLQQNRWNEKALQVIGPDAEANQPADIFRRPDPRNRRSPKENLVRASRKETFWHDQTILREKKTILTKPRRSARKEKRIYRGRRQRV
ncbi:unnamed protein product [Clonostachys rosea f. rosea IK726]|uniref:Uncharacterized protein n=1 Tax=Clonostachys rosea f. rosea IK726 TaxID=1349383 RepID=A0ACA9TF69_BIOOC|nr:unnamed protein product [Clonostachys rosea f. rosea IK726]